MIVRRRLLPVCLAVLSLAFSAPAQAQRQGEKTRDQVIADGVAFLKKSQAEDGTWSRGVSLGVTGLATIGLLRGGKVPADDPQVAKALAVIESLKNDESGDLANDAKLFQKNYVTAVNLSALLATGDEKHRPLVEKAVGYIKQSQIDEGEGKSTADLEYGGFGYQPGTRPDLSNTQFALDALALAGVPSSDPVFQKAAVFASRTQNLASPHNTQPWADKINDGSFIYVLSSGRGAATPADAPRPGYGSMTYSGLKCLSHAGLAQSDPRLAAGLKWLAKNYSVDVHPGREAGVGGQGYYYYLLVMAKALNELGVDRFVDADGKERDWRADITRALTSRQQADGSWANQFRNWQETNADLCTAYALITLAYTEPKN
jgi:squalene-hopene/tetraprenyl-beta-curcumene cyclase